MARAQLCCLHVILILDSKYATQRFWSACQLIAEIPDYTRGRSYLKGVVNEIGYHVEPTECGLL